MKSFVVLSFGFAAAAVAKPLSHEKRQVNMGWNLGGGFYQSLSKITKSTPLTPVLSKELKPNVFSIAKRKQIVWGPIAMGPAGGKHANGFGLKLDENSDMLESALDGACADCMIFQATAHITDKNGKKMGLQDGIYLHHVVMVDSGHTLNMAPLLPATFSCPAEKGGLLGVLGSMLGSALSNPKGSTSAKPPASGAASHGHGQQKRSPQWNPFGGVAPGSFSIFLAKGNEGDASTYAPLNSSRVKSGYWLGKNDKLSVIAELINYKTVPRDDAYFSIDLEYIPFSDGRPKEYLDVGFGVIMTESCGDISLHPPKDRQSTYNSTDFVSLKSGYIVGLTPHLHDGGLNMRVLVNDKVQCEADAIYGQDGGTIVGNEKWETITSYSPCREPIQVNAGDRVKLSSDYDLRKHKLRPASASQGMEGEGEAMAVGLFQFATGY